MSEDGFDFVDDRKTTAFIVVDDEEQREKRKLLWATIGLTALVLIALIGTGIHLYYRVSP